MIEIERGETFRSKDDTIWDPDIALAYIEDKVQTILGHHQKDFLGEVSAENLGARFGGYGSFLPMHQRSPSIWSQCKSPKREQCSNLARSPPHASAKRDVSSSSPGKCASQTLKISLCGASVRKNPTLSHDKVADAFPGEAELCSSKSSIFPDPKKLKVRIKMGPELIEQYNAEISSLGLTSPSSSEVNSHDESDGLLFDSPRDPAESPASIIQTMTSFLVPGGLLLSPLSENLRSLTRLPEYSVKGQHEAAPKSSTISIRSSGKISPGHRREKVAGTRRNSSISEDDLSICHNHWKHKSYADDNLGTVQPFFGSKAVPLHDIPAESEKVAEAKKVRVRSRCNSRELLSRISLGDAQDSKSQDKGDIASFRPYITGSEGEGVNTAKPNPKLKAGVTSSSTEYTGVGLPASVNGPALNSRKRLKVSQNSVKLLPKEAHLRTGSYSARESKSVVDTHLECVENPNHLSERPSLKKPKKVNLGPVKLKSAYADKFIEKSNCKGGIDKLSSDKHTVEGTFVAIHSDALKLAEEPSVVIQEDWVACDSCQKWRLLPYGTKSDQLPDKWVCSMLDWLPGRNHCEITEDETTIAVRASQLAPVTETQDSLCAPIDGSKAGVMSESANHFNQSSNPNCAFDPMKKLKLKEKHRVAYTSDPDQSNHKMELQHVSMKDRSSKLLQRSLAGVNTANWSMTQYSNEQSIVLAKTSKRKSNDVIGDDPSQRRKIRKKSAQDLDTVDDRLKSDTIANAAVADNEKKNEEKIAISGIACSSRQSVRNQDNQMQEVADNSHFHVKGNNGGKAAGKKIVLKHYGDDLQQIEACQYQGNNLSQRKYSIKKVSQDTDLHGHKKSQSGQSEEEFKRVQVDGILKRKSAEARVQSSRSKDCPTNKVIKKEQQVSKPRGKLRFTLEDIEKVMKDLSGEPMSTAATSSSSKISDSHKNVSNYIEAKGSPQESVSSSPMRMPYLNQVSSLKMEVAERVDSRINNTPAIGRMKRRGGKNEGSRLAVASKKVSLPTNDNGLAVLQKGSDVDRRHCVPKHDVSRNIRHTFSDESSLRFSQNATSAGKLDLQKLDDDRNDNHAVRVEHGKSIEKGSSQIEASKRGFHLDLHQENKEGTHHIGKHAPGTLRSLERNPISYTSVIGDTSEASKRGFHLDLHQENKEGTHHIGKHAPETLRSLERNPISYTSVIGDTSEALKVSTITGIGNEIDNFRDRQPERPAALEAGLGNRNASVANVSTALQESEVLMREAEKLKTHADFIKNSGFYSESNYEYFKAALKYLHGASLLEACNKDSSKHLEMNPVQMYATAAKLCKTCAYEYEKGHEMAAAALAYKCMEVAYLRVVYCKSSTTSRVWHELQSSLQMVPQGDSPSSSASDVDNLNNLATADKPPSSMGGGSNASHVILPRNRSNFVRLLDYTRDANFAMEAAKKAQEAYTAARVELEELNKTAIVSVKRVMDLSFQNVEELAHLVWPAFNDINCQRHLGG